MRVIDKLPDLTNAELDDLGERIHEAVARLILLRDSTFWRIETFRMLDVVSELTTRQAKWFVPIIKFTMRQRTEEDTLNLPITLPADLKASADEIYRLQSAPRTIKLDEASISQPLATEIFAMELSFSKEKRPTTRKAA